jgi:hypothetical protein
MWIYVLTADCGDGQTVTETYNSPEKALRASLAVLTLSGPDPVSVKIERKRK